MIKGFFTILGAILAIGIFVFCMNAIGMGNYAIWAPMKARIDTHVFRNSQAYTEGYKRDIDNLRIEIAQAKTPEQKQILEDVLRHRVEGYSVQ